MEAGVAEQTKSKGRCWYLTVYVIGALVVAAATLTTSKNFRHSAKPTSIPGTIVEKYTDSLEIALQFFDVQKCTQFSLESLEAQLLLQLLCVRLCAEKKF